MIPVEDREKVIGERLLERFQSGNDEEHRYWVTDVEGKVIYTDYCHRDARAVASRKNGLYWRVSLFGAVLVQDYNAERDVEAKV